MKGEKKISELIYLQEMIEKLRLELYSISQGKPLTDPEVVRASQMLDVLLVEYQKMLCDKINK
ncbi:MAG: Sporulation stage 0, Spo0E-like regulatory phosphatase [Pelosinus sp.]|nr:Sporulation stage 0, Spo0E-like regulatory phosphatase [Pelosinus sp.]